MRLGAVGLSMNPTTLDIPISLSLFQTFSSTSNVGAEPEDSCLLRTQNLTAAQASLTQTKAYLLTSLLASLGARIILQVLHTDPWRVRQALMGPINWRRTPGGSGAGCAMQYAPKFQHMGHLHDGIPRTGLDGNADRWG